MAKKAYVGVNGVARKIKTTYIGIETQIPIYSESSQNVSITAGNISSYFEVTNGTYYFAGSGATFTSNNKGIGNSSAMTTLKAKQDMSALTFNYSYSSETGYDKFTLKVGETTVENGASGATTSKSYSGSLKKGQTIEFLYTKDSSVDTNSDQCTFSNITITAKVQTQTGTEKKSVARKIKKAYVGISGVARLFFGGGGELKYYGTTNGLSFSRHSLSGASVGNYALFAGGYDMSYGVRSTVDAYNSSLVRTTPTELSIMVSGLSGASVGDYALFAGGQPNDGRGATSTVDAYNASLVKSTPAELSISRRELLGASVGDYALFAGGVNNNNSVTSTVDAYNASLVRSTPTELSISKMGLSGASVGDYALFAGGSNNGVTSTVDAYNASLVRSTPTGLSNSRCGLSGTSVGNYALFAGGEGSTFLSTVDAYNASLVRSTPTELSISKRELSGTSVGDFALFAGGTDNTYQASSTVDAYNASLVRSTPAELSISRKMLSGASVGDYALFAGGLGFDSNIGTTTMSTVDVYTVA